MTTPHDDFAMMDGAYVLGSLSAKDRAAFETHLAGCGACANAVRELAHLPGMLAAVPTHLVDHAADEVADDAGPTPATMLPALLRRAAGERRRRRWRAAAAGLAAAGAAVVAAVVVTITAKGQDASLEALPVTAMSAVVPAPIHAELGLRQSPMGTTVTVECRYDARAAYPKTQSYALRVLDRAGGSQQIGAWRVAPGQSITATGTTSLPRGQISAVEITTTDGAPVLRLVL